jgi:hypothetical protein
MKKLIYLLLISVFCIQNVSAQNIELKWSKKMEYKNSKDGFFDSFVGSSENEVYGTFTNYSNSKRKSKIKKLKLVAFDKKTMKKLNEFTLKNSKDKSRSGKIKGLTFEKIVVLKDQVQIYWSKISNSQCEVYVETLDLDLGKKDKLRKIYTAKDPIAKETMYAASSLVILGSKELGDEVVIGCELDKGNGKNVAFSYVSIGSDLKEVSKGEFDLPVIKRALRTTYMSALYCNYELGMDGSLYVKSFVIMSKEERKAAKKGEQIAYSILNIVDIESNNVETYTIKYDGINIFNFNILNEGDEVRIYGFFSDIEKDPEGKKSHGIFYSTITEGEMDEPKFTYFDQETAEKLFAKPKVVFDEVSDKHTKRKRGSSSSKPVSSEDAIDQHYQIEFIKFLDKDHVVLFCSKMYNYTVTTCTSSSSGGSSCTTRPYCRKTNVTAFNLNNSGEIVWTANVSRDYTYSGWDINDLRVVSEDNNYYVIYGSAWKSTTNAKGKKVSKTKSRTESRDNFEYATIDIKTGEATTKDKMVNSSSTERKERKSVSPLAIKVYDNQFFINSTKVRINPYVIAGGCVLGIACPPVIALPFLIPAFRNGTGYLGTIKISK